MHRILTLRPELQNMKTATINRFLLLIIAPQQVGDGVAIRSAKGQNFRMRTLSPPLAA
jgi:hypothetical protein